MTFKTYQNLPFKAIPTEDRLKKGDLAICQGGCNSIKKIDNTTYQLCGTCRVKWRFNTHSCDVPNCNSVGDGTTRFELKENKLVCYNCYQSWNTLNWCAWERFVEERHLYYLRPTTFTKALEEGIISLVEKENQVKVRAVAECHHCYEEKRITTVSYQLCGTCRFHLQYHGNTCQVCEINDAQNFDTSESIFVCNQCSKTKQNYKIASYHIYKTQIRTIKNCQICNDPVSHDRKEGESRCSANIDHDHDTGITRGVVCISCNTIEGFIKTIGITPYAYATRLKSYLENPPLDKSWTQDRDSFR